MANNALKKIITRAKQLKKKHPGTAWKNLVKKAGAEYRNGTIKGKRTRRTRKTVKKSSRPKKVYRRKVASASVSGMSVSTASAFIRNSIKDRLAKSLVRREMATTKRAKRIAGKIVTHLKQSLKKFQ